MRTLPNMAVVQPADAVGTRGAVEYIARHDGPVFLRLTRQKVIHINREGYDLRRAWQHRLRGRGRVKWVGV